VFSRTDSKRLGFKTHFEVEKMCAVRANRDTRDSLKQPFYILHNPQFQGKSLKISKSRKTSALCLPNP
jgi:hypothetical protein